MCIESSFIPFYGFIADLFFCYFSICFHQIIFCCLDVPQFIHLPTEEYLGCFQIFAFINNAAINFLYRFLCGHEFAVHLDKYQSI